MGDIKYRSGVVPFFTVDDELKMMFMKPSDPNYGGDRFQIAKGLIDEGENPLEAGLREANEELGLRDSNIVWVEKVGIFLSNHYIFIAEVSSVDPDHFDEVSYETGAVRWLTLDEYTSIGRELHIPIVKECVNRFKQRG